MSESPSIHLGAAFGGDGNALGRLLVSIATPEGDHVVLTLTPEDARKFASDICAAASYVELTADC